MIKKYITILFGVIFLFTGCTVDKNIIRNPSDMIKLDCEISNEVVEDNTLNTKCYINKDGTYTMYLFASPIAYYNNGYLKEIDNSIIDSDNSNYKFQNKSNDIKTYFPEDITDGLYIKNETDEVIVKLYDNTLNFSPAVKKTYRNVYGDKVNAVKYHNKNIDLFFYPTVFGINAEFLIYNSTINQLSFDITANGKNQFYDFYIRYIANGTTNETGAIVHDPIVYSSNKFNDTVKKDILKNKDSVILRYTFDCDKNTSFNMSFELYKKKMLDCSVYSNIEWNCFLHNYSFIGKSFLGEGYHLAKNNIHEYIDIPYNNILSLKYVIKELYNNAQDSVKFYRNTKEWSSSTICWKGGNVSTEFVMEEKPDNNKNYIFDLSRILKDQLSFEHGYTLKKEKGMSIICTNDNSMYFPYYKIVYKK